MVEPAFWTSRRKRAAVLAGERPHAAELLRFYVAVLDRQADVYEWGSRAGWREDLGRVDGAFPRLDLTRAPAAALRSRFGELVPEIAAVGTDVLRDVGGRLGASDALRDRVLREFLTAGQCRAAAAELGVEPAAVEVFPHAMLQPVAWAATAETPDASWRGSTCPVCGWPPVAAQIRDEEDVPGRRRLVCVLCAHAWVFPRATCPVCGETASDKLGVHVDEAAPHVRVEECSTCRTYLKAVDLRERGDAVPEVEDLATVDLDLWAREQGLRKVRANLLGV